MKKIIALVTLTLSLSSFAAEKVSFTYNGNEGWGQTFYSCDYAEAQTESYLELFGATEIEVYCFGGISAGTMISPVSINAKFELPVLNGSEVALITEVKGDNWNPACGINTYIVKKLLPKFSNVAVLSKSDSCAFQSSNYSYKFSITK